MSEEKKENTVWGIIGKISVVIIIIWTFIQIYNYFKPQYSAEVLGNYHKIYYPDIILKERKELSLFKFFQQKYPFHELHITSK
ncbi:MAG: hypothetical protein MUC49_16865 [Raineya sp.]|jgi:hypothetical protein|nr:hypothetical protein [Raineya sp.]